MLNLIPLPIQRKAIHATKERFGWEFISKVRDAFATKAITGISMSVLALNSFGVFDRIIDVSLLNFKLTLLGSILFLAGYVFSGIKMPSEFQTGATVPELVVQKRNISSISYMKEEICEARNLHEEMCKLEPFDIPDTELKNLKSCIDELSRMKPTRALRVVGSLYDASLRVREWTQPRDRMVSMSLFGLGFLFLSLPTLIGLVKVLLS